jgi:hypothetical protein
MFATFDSGLSRNNNFNTAIDVSKRPQISKSMRTNDVRTVKIQTPKVKEPFITTDLDIYQQPLLTKYTPYHHNFAIDRFSSLPNAPLLQKNENFNKSVIILCNPFFYHSFFIRSCWFFSLKIN